MSKRVYTVNYWLKNSQGEVVDTSEGGEPMRFIEGSNKVIPGIQKAVIGREVGELVEATVPPALAYGEHQTELVTKMPKSAFEGVEEVLVGMKFQTNQGGDARVVKVVEVTKDYAVVDANHPLAGLTLVFDLEILDVSEAREEDFMVLEGSN